MSSFDFPFRIFFEIIEEPEFAMRTIAVGFGTPVLIEFD